eukprot:SAG31_NODE_1597_length_7799_cov_37.912857_8_plen_110_part_00
MEYAVATFHVVVSQGPNYALAKKIQMWRSTLLLQRGVGVSVNMAPPSRTESVIHSAQAKAGVCAYHMTTTNTASSLKICVNRKTEMMGNVGSGGRSHRGPQLVSPLSHI